MSRTGWSDFFDNFLRNSNAVVSGYPVTLACWANISSVSVSRRIMGIYNSLSGADNNNISIGCTTFNNKLMARSCDGSGSSDAYPSTIYTAGQWFHIAGVFSSATSRAIYLDGGSKGTNTTSRAPTGQDRSSIGIADGSDPSQGLGSTDKIAHAAVWDIALSDAEVASLATAPTIPPAIQPDHLVAYWPLAGTDSPEPDTIGGFDMVIQGSLGQGTDPFVAPFLVNIAGVSASGGAGTFAPSISAPLTGASAIGQIGTLDALIPLLVRLAGVSSVGSAGNLNSSVFKTLADVSAAGSAGTLIPNVKPAISGVSATGAAGSFSSEVLFNLLGVEGTMALGALVADTATRINLVGVSATGPAGTFTAAVKFLLQGVGATGDVGDLAEEISMALQDVAAQTGVGDFTISDGWTKIGGQVATVWTNISDTPAVWTDVPGNPTTWTLKH